MRITLISVFVSLFIAVAPALAGDTNYTVTSDISFGDLPRQVLDIYSPAEVNDDTPVLLFLFGGGFVSGSKEQARVIGQNFAEAGMIVVTPNYRINTTFPNFVEDAAKAAAYVWQTLKTSAGDPRPMVMSGWSAGAYIAAKVSYDGRYLEAEGVSPDAIAGFIGLAGPYWGGLCAGSSCPNTFLPGSEADWPVADFVDPSDPPMLLVQGTRDNYVDIGNLEALAAAGTKAGLDVTTLVLKDKFHKQVMYMMEDEGTEVRDAAEAFIAKVTSN
jgi:acetyl esterase/lipase